MGTWKVLTVKSHDLSRSQFDRLPLCQCTVTEGFSFLILSNTDRSVFVILSRSGFNVKL